MLWTNIKRVVNAGFVSFWRNSFVSLAAVLVMVVTLFVIGSLFFMSAMLTTALAEIKEKVDINVYFITTAEEEDILAIKRSLEALPEVATVGYVSREQALTDFRARHETDQLTLQALDELGENPFGALLNVQAHDPSQYQGIAAFLESGSALSKNGATIVDKVNYFQERHQIAIERLTNIINSGRTLGFAVIFLFAATTIAITFNTIRLIIFTSRDEISVMRLVGASNMYIRGPFVFEGVMYGVIAAIITLVLFYPVTLWLGKTTENFFGGINIFEYYLGNFAVILLLILGTGVVLGGLSSFLAVRRYLKV